jgi:mannitol-1-phosphate/altronate dehydrogenase
MSQLRAQDHLFTVMEKGADGNQPIVVGAVHECLNAKLDSLAAIIEKFCEPQVAIVSLTITEKGYCIDPATGKLDLNNARIIHDLETPCEPHSAPGSWWRLCTDVANVACRHLLCFPAITSRTTAMS